MSLSGRKCQLRKIAPLKPFFLFSHQNSLCRLLWFLLVATPTSYKFGCDFSSMFLFVCVSHVSAWKFMLHILNVTGLIGWHVTSWSCSWFQDSRKISLCVDFRSRRKNNNIITVYKFSRQCKSFMDGWTDRNVWYSYSTSFNSFKNYRV